MRVNRNKSNWVRKQTLLTSQCNKWPNFATSEFEHARLHYMCTPFNNTLFPPSCLCVMQKLPRPRSQPQRSSSAETSALTVSGQNTAYGRSSVLLGSLKRPEVRVHFLIIWFLGVFFCNEHMNWLQGQGHSNIECLQFLLSCFNEYFKGISGIRINN